MTTARELAKQGLCELCQAPVAHGPYTDDQIRDISADLGTDEAEFYDWCDGCFVREVAGGDRLYAAKMLGRVAL